LRHLAGIRSQRFSIGFGPVLLERQRAAFSSPCGPIPLGCFVAFPDDDEDEDQGAIAADLSRSARGNRPCTERALVIAAGVLANLLRAWDRCWGRDWWWAFGAGFSANHGRWVCERAVRLGQAGGLSGLGRRRSDRQASRRSACWWRARRRWFRPGRRYQGRPQAQTLDLVAERDGKTLTLNLTPATTTASAASAPSCNQWAASLSAPHWPMEVINQTNRIFAQLTARTMRWLRRRWVPRFSETWLRRCRGPVKIVEHGRHAGQERRGQQSLPVKALDLDQPGGSMPCPALPSMAVVPAAVIEGVRTVAPCPSGLQDGLHAVGLPAVRWGSVPVLYR